MVAVVGTVIMSQWNFRVMKIIFTRIRECCLTPNKLSISCKTLGLEKVTPETSVALMYSFFIQKIGAGMIIPKLRLSKYQARVISLRRFFQERWVSMMIFSGYVDVRHTAWEMIVLEGHSHDILFRMHSFKPHHGFVMVGVWKSKIWTSWTLYWRRESIWCSGEPRKMPKETWEVNWVVFCVHWSVW